jgi:hypothetical protein
MCSRPPLSPRMDIGGSGTPGQSGDPSPQAMLRAMSSGRAFFGEDNWGRFRVGPPSERLQNFFDSASYVSYSLFFSCRYFLSAFLLRIFMV